MINLRHGDNHCMAIALVKERKEIRFITSLEKGYDMGEKSHRYIIFYFLDLQTRKEKLVPLISRSSPAPILFKCCRVDFNKETNRLEIRKGEFISKTA